MAAKQADENILRTFESKVLRRIYGPIHEKGGWKIRVKHGIDELIGGKGKVRFIKAQIILYLGYLERMEQRGVVVVNLKPEW